MQSSYRILALLKGKEGKTKELLMAFEFIVLSMRALVEFVYKSQLDSLLYLTWFRLGFLHLLLKELCLRLLENISAWKSIKQRMEACQKI